MIRIPVVAPDAPVDEAARRPTALFRCSQGTAARGAAIAGRSPTTCR